MPVGAVIDVEHAPDLVIRASAPVSDLIGLLFLRRDRPVHQLHRPAMEFVDRDDHALPVQAMVVLEVIGLGASALNKQQELFARIGSGGSPPWRAA